MINTDNNHLSKNSKAKKHSSSSFVCSFLFLMATVSVIAVMLLNELLLERKSTKSFVARIPNNNNNSGFDISIDDDNDNDNNYVDYLIRNLNPMTVYEQINERIFSKQIGLIAPSQSIKRIKIGIDSDRKRGSSIVEKLLNANDQEIDDVSVMTEEEVQESIAEHDDAIQDGEEGPAYSDNDQSTTKGDEDVDERSSHISEGNEIEEGEEDSKSSASLGMLSREKVSHNARWCGGQSDGFGWKAKSEADAHRKSLAKRVTVGRKLLSSTTTMNNVSKSDGVRIVVDSLYDDDDDDVVVVMRRNTLAIRNPRRTRGGTGTTPISGKYSQGYFGCERLWGKIKNENENKAQIVEPISDSELSPGLKAVKSCVKDISKCGADAMRGAAELPSTSLIHALPNSGKKKYNSCAVVGNAGSLLKSKAYGEAIDKHDVVMRFNVMDLTEKLAPNVGTRTTFRMVNHLRSRHACCPRSQGGKGKMPEKGGQSKGMSLILWHPGRQAQLLRACKKNIPNAKVSAISDSYITKEVKVMNAMRKDLMRLGFGPFNDWKQGTSGFHGILLLAGMCDHLSLYGVTSFSAKKGKSKGPDQYGGRGSKNDASWVWHDWEGEAYAWRLLHATGKATVCSNS